MQLLLQQIRLDPTLQELDRFRVELDGSSLQIVSPDGETVQELSFASRRHLVIFLVMSVLKLMPDAGTRIQATVTRWVTDESRAFEGKAVLLCDLWGDKQ